MRLKSALFVSALIRRCQVEGVVAVLTRRGAEEAGAIYVVVDRLDGTNDLYAPAPQTAFAEEAGDRLFQCVLTGASGLDISGRLEREARFDPDFWVVTVEDREDRPFLDLAPG